MTEPIAVDLDPPGTLDRVVALAADWFRRHLTGTPMEGAGDVAS